MNAHKCFITLKILGGYNPILYKKKTKKKQCKYSFHINPASVRQKIT